MNRRSSLAAASVTVIILLLGSSAAWALSTVRVSPKRPGVRDALRLTFTPGNALKRGEVWQVLVTAPKSCRPDAAALKNVHGPRPARRRVTVVMRPTDQIKASARWCRGRADLIVTTFRGDTQVGTIASGSVRLG